MKDRKEEPVIIHDGLDAVFLPSCQIGFMVNGDIVIMGPRTLRNCAKHIQRLISYAVVMEIHTKK